MNYKSELKGFCFDRALHYHEKLAPAELAGVLKTADTLADYFYMAEKDWADSGAHLMTMADEIDLDMLDELVNTLKNVHDRRTAHADRLAAKTLKAVGEMQ